MESKEKGTRENERTGATVAASDSLLWTQIVKWKSLVKEGQVEKGDTEGREQEKSKESHV